MNNMTLLLIAGGVVIAVVIAVLSRLLLRKRPHKLNKQYYEQSWQTLQSLLKNKSSWPLAIINADKLLDDALKKCHYKGKTMGERLVSAQHDIKNNDDVWFGHKLRNQLVHETDVKLKERDVKEALLGIRAALKDLGAF